MQIPRADCGSFDARIARRTQELLSRRVIEEPLKKPAESICGMDVSYSRPSQSTGGRGQWAGTGAAVVLSYPDLKLLEVETVKKKVILPYISTFLAFREMPYLAALFSKLRERPDVYLINGHGIYHPAFFGAASHFGVVFGVASIGVAGRPIHLQGEVLVGNEVVLGGRRLARIVKPGAFGRRRRNQDQAGESETGVSSKAMYVSVGNRITLDQASEIVSKCIKDHRMPEPLFLADSISREQVARGHFANVGNKK